MEDRLMDDSFVAKKLEDFYEKIRKRTNKFAAKIDQTPQAILENNMNVFCRESGVTAEDLNHYLGERGVLYISDILDGMAMKDDILGCLMLSQVIEHLINQIKEKQQEIAQNG